MTSEPFRIGIEPAKLLSTVQELAVLREAQARQPGSALLRGRLASALLLDNAFGEVIALLAPAEAEGADQAGVPPLGTDERLVFLQAHLSREAPAADRQTVEFVDRWLPLTGDAADRAQLLADRAKASRRLGDVDGARVALEQALALDPANKDACKRLASIDLDTEGGSGRAGDVIATLDRLAARGASHSRLHAARALAHARAGEIAAAREVVAFEAFHHAGLLDVPEGMESLAAFNAALAAELLAHPELRFERYGTASEQTWRIDAPVLGAAPMVRLLLRQIALAAQAHVNAIPPVDHPWLNGRPEAGVLHCWCVLTDGAGYETWHVHQFGWLSGVYYVQIPPSVAAGDDKAGCIAFGLPEEGAGEEAAAEYGTRIVRPQEGMLMLFPSHSYHRTFPHGAAERRICIAFDIWPA